MYSSVTRQKGESQNGCLNKAKHAKISEKQTFLTPLIRTRTCAYQGGNPNKSKTIILKIECKTKVNLNICNENITITDTIKLLGIDKDLTFDIHIAQLCSKAAAQVNAISRLNRYLGKSEIVAIINNFSYANFNYCPLV